MDKGLHFFDELLVRAPLYKQCSYDLNTLPAIFADQDFLTAVKLASPAFYAVLASSNFDWAKLGEKEHHTLRKYYNRMCFRPVPFGAFASFGTTAWERPAPELSPILHRYSDGIHGATYERPIDPDLVLTLNPCLYKVGRNYRFLNTRFTAQSSHRYRLDAVDSEQFYRSLFALKWPLTARELTAWLTDKTDTPADEAPDYVYYFLDEQLLLSQQQPSPVGPAPAWTKGAAYAALERKMAGPSTQSRETLTRLIPSLQRLALPRPIPALEQFKKDFRRRFDRQAVPLLVALDPDTGFPYDEHVANRPMDWLPQHRLLLEKWQADGQPIELTIADLASLPSPSLPLPPSMGILFRETAEGLVLDYAAGTSALQLAGRFSLFSEAVHQQCRAIAVEEQAANPGVVFADIGLLADAHVDNINRRLPIYDYEIPVNVVSGLPPAKQLPPNDLYLRLDKNELLLFSKKLKKRIIPRLSTAYNYRRCDLKLFRLLCDMQYQSVRANLGLDPEAYFPGLPYYPRITLDGLILSPAKWRFRNGQPDLEILPSKIALGKGDQKLVFDLADPAQKDFFSTVVQGEKEILIEEYFPAVQEHACQFAGNLMNPVTVYQPVALPKLPTTRRAYPLGSDWLYLKMYCSPPTADLILKNVITPLVKRLEKQLRCWFFIRYTDDDGDHLRLRLRTSGDPGTVLTQVHAQLNRSGLAGRVRDTVGETYYRELERYGAAPQEFIEQVFEAGSRYAAKLYTQPVNQQLLFAAALRCAQAIAGGFYAGPELKEFYGQLESSFFEEFGGGKPLRLELDRAYREQKLVYQVALEADDDLAALAEAVSKVINVISEGPRMPGGRWRPISFTCRSTGFLTAISGAVNWNYTTRCHD